MAIDVLEGEMGFEDKVEHKAEEAGGIAKEKIGEATDDERLQAEGETDQAESKVKQAGEHVKDAGGKVADVFRD